MNKVIKFSAFLLALSIATPALSYDMNTFYQGSKAAITKLASNYMSFWKKHPIIGNPIVIISTLWLAKSVSDVIQNNYARFKNQNPGKNLIDYVGFSKQ